MGDDVSVAPEDTVAIQKSRLLPVNVPDGTQPCNVFGVHPSMALLKELYEAGDAAFIANIGSLIEPISSRAEYRAKSVRIPPSIGSHNTQTKQAQSVHAQHAGAKGVLGRIVDALTFQANAHKSQGYSVAGNQKMTQGKLSPIQIDKRTGLKRLQKFGQLGGSIMEMSGHQSQSVFADTFASQLESALETANRLGAVRDLSDCHFRKTATE